MGNKQRNAVLSDSDLNSKNNIWRKFGPTIFVGLAVLIVAFLADVQHRQLELQAERDRVRREVQVLAAQVEQGLTSPIRAVRGLVALLASEPDMSQERYSWLAQAVTDTAPEIRNIAGARDLVVNLVHPVEGNEGALGLDYSKNDKQRAAAYYVRDKGEFILAGPLELVQGGQALIGRFPVFAKQSGTHAFWGILSVVIDLPAFYERTGIVQGNPTLDLALVGRDGAGRDGAQFFGAPELLTDDPISDVILFPNGSWMLYARPLDGWGTTIEQAQFRLLLAVVALGTIGLVGLTNHHSVQRKATIHALQRREYELENARNEVESLALHDHLTGLPNRRLLERRLQEIKTCPYLGLVQLDLDGFKEVNDNHGHAVGDLVLIQVAARLKSVTDQQTVLVRSGGDEFVAILMTGDVSGMSRQAREEKLEDVALRMIECMKQPIVVKGHKCWLGISAGIHVYDPSDNLTPEEGLMQADRAMYEAKQTGRNRFRFATPGERCKEPKHHTADLIEALNASRIIPYYQPQFGVDGCTIVGAEALARWQHPDGSISSPGEFMSLAQSLKIEGELDHRIFESAARDLCKWDEQGISVPQVSVNMSFRRLNDRDLISMVDHVKVDADRISLELLESIFLDDENSLLIGNIEALKKRGFRIEIDDFGTGYSSITSLLRLRPHCFKIDRSLVQAAPKSAANRRLLSSIAEMGHALSIQVCAEGIETQEELETARSVGCTVFQGFLLAPPMSAEEFAEFASAANGDLARAVARRA